MTEDFENELKNLINRHCVDDYCGTPDFLLSQMIVAQLRAYAAILNENKAWHGWVGLEKHQ
jgi:hypothetical protein